MTSGPWLVAFDGDTPVGMSRCRDKMRRWETAGFEVREMDFAAALAASRDAYPASAAAVAARLRVARHSHDGPPDWWADR